MKLKAGNGGLRTCASPHKYVHFRKGAIDLFTCGLFRLTTFSSLLLESFLA